MEKTEVFEREVLPPVSQDILNLIYGKIASGRKLCIFGIGVLSEQFCNRYGFVPEFFLDEGTKADTFLDRPVYDVYDYVYFEKAEHFVVAIKYDELTKSAYPYYNRIILSRAGLVYRKDYVIIPISKKFPLNNQLDYMLGSSRRYENNIEGFERYGTGKFCVVALGGSTTDPYVNYRNSWPQYLWELLKSNGIDATVYNGGFAGYTSKDELFKLIRDVFVLKPDLAICYNGVNDLFFADNYEGHSRYKRPHLSNYQESFFRQFGDVLYGLQDKRTVAESYLDSLKLMKAICDIKNTKYYAFFQPCFPKCSEHTKEYHDGYKDVFADFTVLGSMLKVAVNNSYEEFYGIKSAISEYDFIFDFSDLFEEIEDLHYDYAHVNAKGNMTIAANIYKSLECVII